MATAAPAAGTTSNPERAKRTSLARNWGLVLLRGILAIALGIATFILPGVALASLILAFAIYLLADGIIAVASGIRAARHHERWGWLIVEGLAGLVAGLVALFLPVATFVALVALASAWGVVSGVAMIIAAFRLDGAHGRGSMLLGGLLSVVWGVLLFFWPVAGALVLTLWFGAYALAFGIMLVLLSIRLRRRARDADGLA